MRKTKETYHKPGTATSEQCPCRFAEGDEVLFPFKGEVRRDAIHSVYWDDEFGGWLLALGCIGVHEQNFIPSTERDLWTPHEDGLWSWWERKPATEGEEDA